VRVVQRRLDAVARPDADRLVDVRVDERPRHEVRDQRDDELLVPDLGLRQLRHAARDLFAGEGDVPRLLQHVDPVDHPDQRLDAVVVHLLALQPVEHLLGDQDRAVARRAVGDRRHQLRELPQPRHRAVGGAADPRRHPREHRRVPAFVGDLGERELRVRGRRVLLVDLLEQHLHQEDFEPQPGGRDAGDLVLAELDALLRRQLVPELGAVEGGALVRDETLALDQRRGPVDVDVGVVELVRRRLEQPLRGLVAIRFLQRPRHGRQPLPKRVT
jgi:hypothetical protein